MQCYFAIFEGNDIYNNDLCIRMELNSDWGKKKNVAAAASIRVWLHCSEESSCGKRESFLL